MKQSILSAHYIQIGEAMTASPVPEAPEPCTCGLNREERGNIYTASPNLHAADCPYRQAPPVPEASTIVLSRWDIYAICGCGWHTRVPFGERFHIQVEVCPDCGESKSNFEIKTARLVKDRGWFKPERLEVKP